MEQSASPTTIQTEFHEKSGVFCRKTLTQSKQWTKGVGGCFTKQINDIQDGIFLSSSLFKRLTVSVFFFRNFSTYLLESQ